VTTELIESTERLVAMVRKRTEHERDLRIRPPELATFVAALTTSCMPLAEIKARQSSVIRTHAAPTRRSRPRASCSSSCTRARRLELFARGLARTGWTCWGNQAEPSERSGE
jgi:hypothetical protein